MICIRGAISVLENTEEEILKKTRMLIEEIELRNHIKRHKVVSMIFSTTKDLDKVAPSKAARKMGYKYTALMNFDEMEVPNTLEKCIRVSVFYDVDKKQELVNHVYLEKASTLRPDLA